MGSRSGSWRVTLGAVPLVQVAGTSGVEARNGLAADWGQHALYATDSTAGTVSLFPPGYASRSRSTRMALAS